MVLKNMKSFNQKTLKSFKDWIQFLPITWLSNLTPQKFSEQCGVSLLEAEEFFLELLKNNLAEAKVNICCPGCKDCVTIDYKSLKSEFECDNCGHAFIPYDCCLDGDVLYRINKQDFFDAPQTKSMPQINRLLKNFPIDDIKSSTKENVIFLEHAPGDNPDTKELCAQDSVDENALAEDDNTVSCKLEQTKVFISYSHKDKKHLERLKVHLKPLTWASNISFWEDTKIRTGQLWREEIKKAIDSASVAILLVSADFLASNFIANNELPPLLMSAKEKGTVIMPVILSPCFFTHIESLSCFQAVNDPNEPLISLAPASQESLWVKLAEEITDIIKSAS